MNIETIWQTYQPNLTAFLRSKVSNSADVDDLLQEVLIKTYKHRQTIKSETSIKAWLFQTAHHTVIDFYRKRAKAQNVAAEDLWYADNDEQFDIQDSLSQCLPLLIDSLPEETAELLKAVDIHGLSQKEHANKLGIRYSTLKSRVQKGRLQLRTVFENCCHLSLDTSGGIIDFDPKPNVSAQGSCNQC